MVKKTVALDIAVLERLRRHSTRHGALRAPTQGRRKGVKKEGKERGKGETTGLVIDLRIFPFIKGFPFPWPKSREIVSGGGGGGEGGKRGKRKRKER